MKPQVILRVLLVLVMAAALVQAAETPVATSAMKNNSLGLKGAPTPFSLLDLSRIKWSNSYSVSYFSGGGRSGSVGLLNTSMMYDLSPKLSMTLDMGLLHSPSALWGDKKNSATLLPGFRLDYHPSETFRMILDVRKVTGAVLPYDGNGGYYYGPSYPY